TDRTLAPGDLLIVDVGATWRGYFCDFDRNFALGRAPAEMREAYARVFSATEAGLAAARPGRTAAEVWHAMAAVVDPGGRAATPVGRIGHGLGLHLPARPPPPPADGGARWPRAFPSREARRALPAAAALARRRMVHEENVVITATGGELLSRRAPPELPLV